jgi:hypothetical protein
MSIARSVDEDAKKLMANLIKEFYDFSLTTTTILVGGAENISELVEGHQSIDRAIVEIPLSRMSDDELREIIEKRASRTVMTFSTDAIWTIIVLSRGLPYFTQTLSKHAAIQVVDNKRIEVTNDDVEASMTRFIEDSQKSFKEAYRAAIRSNQDHFLRTVAIGLCLSKDRRRGIFHCERRC